MVEERRWKKIISNSQEDAVLHFVTGVWSQCDFCPLPIPWCLNLTQLYSMWAFFTHRVTSLPSEKAGMLSMGVRYVETQYVPPRLPVKFLFFSFALHWLCIFQGDIFSASANTLNSSGPPGDCRHSQLVDAYEGHSGHAGERKGLSVQGNMRENATLKPLRGNLFLKLGTEKYLRIKIWLSI